MQDGRYRRGYRCGDGARLPTSAGNATADTSETAGSGADVCLGLFAVGSVCAECGCSKGVPLNEAGGYLTDKRDATPRPYREWVKQGMGQTVHVIVCIAM